MRALVIGGRGFVGARSVRALRRVPGAEVLIASRNPRDAQEVRLDLREPSTFAAMKGFDFVVNCSDSSVAPPEEAAAYCLAEGCVFLETTTDMATHDRLYARFRAQNQQPPPRGALVLGVGLFPGLSNLVAGALARSVPDCQRLELGVRLNPVSGAGEGMCAVMAHMLVAPAPCYDQGRRIDDVALRPGIRMPFEGRPRATIKCGLPEGALLHWSTRVPSTAAYISTTIPLPAPVVNLLTWVLARGEGVRRVVQGLLRMEFLLLRARLLRDRPTPIVLTATANRSGPPTGAEPSLSLKVDDGVLATAYAIAASVQVLARGEHRPGCHLPDECLALSEVLEAMRTLSSGELEISGPWAPAQVALPSATP